MMARLFLIQQSRHLQDFSLFYPHKIKSIQNNQAIVITYCINWLHILRLPNQMSSAYPPVPNNHAVSVIFNMKKHKLPLI